MRWTGLALAAVFLTAAGCTYQAPPKVEDEPDYPPGPEFLQPELPHTISSTAFAGSDRIAMVRGDDFAGH